MQPAETATPVPRHQRWLLWILAPVGGFIAIGTFFGALAFLGDVSNKPIAIVRFNRPCCHLRVSFCAISFGRSALRERWPLAGLAAILAARDA